MSNSMTLNQFQVGGSLASGSRIYVERSADAKIISALQSNELCYVFNTRQIGKSSLLLKTKEHMQAQGYLCSYIDISRIGSINISAEQWYAGLAFELWRNFALPAGNAFFTWWLGLGDIPPSHKLVLFWEEHLPSLFPEKKFILFFDEIDSVISLPFAADDFFSAIRSSYNSQSTAVKDNRLNFALFGVALPGDLIKESHCAPFNIGTAIELDCFTLEESYALLTPFDLAKEQKSVILQRTLYWTGGQPFLTQKLLSKLTSHFTHDELANITAVDIDNIVNKQFIENWRNNDNPEHLKTIYDRITLDHSNNIQLLSDYLKVCFDAQTPDALSNYQRLYLTGLVHIKNKKVEVKSQLYKQIFSHRWAEKELSKLRPYHEKMQQWLVSQSAEHLLDEEALIKAKAWANNHILSENDHQFLALSQEKISEVIKLKNVQLNYEITQRRATEERLQKTLAELDIAKQQAEQANKAKSHFLAKVSHEVRTHINSIIGINYLANLQPTNKEHHKSIDRAANYLQNVINDLVDINKIERGELPFKQETFYVDTIFDNLIHINAPTIFNKGLNFIIDIPHELSPALISDPHRIEQVLSNLLSNAIKYCTKGSITIGYHAQAISLENKQVCYEFFVKDTGCGIADNNTSGIVSNQKHSILQPGIGLTICAELLNLMHSELHVASNVEQGTCFSFTLTLDIANTGYCNTQELPRVGVPSTLPHNILQALIAIGCPVVTYNVKDTEFEQKDIEFFILDESYQLYQQQLLVLASSCNLALVPLTKIGNNIPHWLNTLNFQKRLDQPITPRKMFNDLIDLKRPVEKDLAPPSMIDASNDYQVLVVEDDEINQEVISALLAMAGLNATIVNNGKEAVNTVLHLPFNLILMDIEMPIMNGLEAVKLLRSSASIEKKPELKHIPIIAMTAHALLGDKEKFIKSGFNDHISKPIDPSQLHTVLSQWLPLLKSIAAEQPKIAFPAIDDIQVTAGLARCNNNLAVYSRILEKFAAKYQNTAALADYSTENLGLFFHAVKGTSGNLGASNLSHLAAELERQCLANQNINSTQLHNFTTVLHNTCNNIQLTLKSMKQSNPQHSKQSHAMLTLNTAKKLKQALDSDHSQALELCAALNSSKDATTIAVCQHVNNFDMEQASIVLSEWITLNTDINKGH